MNVRKKEDSEKLMKTDVTNREGKTTETRATPVHVDTKQLTTSVTTLQRKGLAPLCLAQRGGTVGRNTAHTARFFLIY